MNVRTSSGVAMCLCALVGLGAMRSTDAAALLVADDRELEVELDFSEDGFASGVGPLLVTPDFGVDYDDVLAAGPTSSDPNGDVDGEATATQVSTFDAWPTFSMITASGSANISAVIRDFSGVNDGSASADSIFDILFTVATQQTWSITASIDDAGSGITSRVRLRPVGESDLFLLQGSSGVLNDIGSGVLEPGITYQLRGEARVAGFVNNFGGATVSNRDGAFSLEFNVIPEPATGLLFLLCGPMILRRRTAR